MANNIKRKVISRSPECYMISFMVKSNGNNWNFHKNDADPNPSTPHGHSGRNKLNPYTGEVFDASTGKIVYNLRKKALIKILKALIANKEYAPYKEALQLALNSFFNSSEVVKQVELEKSR